MSSSETHSTAPSDNGWDMPFETIVETINDGILVLRLGGEILYANVSMASMIGYTAEEMVGESLFDFMDDEWSQKARENLERRQAGVAEMFDHRWRHSNGSGVWTLVSAKPMSGDDGAQWGSLVAIQDISRRKATEEKLRRARKELEQRVAERTEQLVETNDILKTEVKERRLAEERALKASRTKSTFLANMSHELRTPLNAVIGYTELIQEDIGAFQHGADAAGQLDSVHADLGKVHRAANHLLALINDILDLAKVEAGKLVLHREPMNIEELIGDVVETMEPMAGKNGNELCTGLDKRGEIIADRTKLKQVLLNLVSNASKFTEDGCIELTTAPASVDGADGICIEVRDTGIGIAEDKIDRLFEPFTQADESTTREHGGTGLGLAICKQFCEMMGGHIRVESRLGKGTAFRVELPAETAVGLAEFTTSATELSPDTDTVSQDLGGPTLLVIDDDPSVHELMRRFLGPQGFRVYSAFDGEEGLERAADLQPDVITLDVMMPGQDGWSVLSSLKTESDLQSIPVVMVTMMDDKSIGYGLGASDYLVKPIRRQRLIKTLARFHPARGGLALVVEDEDDLREVVARQLRGGDWRVQTAADGTSALDRLGEERPDVVLLDLMMPEMDGFEVADIMRQEPRWKDIPIVVVTAMDLDDTDRSRLQESVERIVSKDGHFIDQIVAEVIAVAGQPPSADDPPDRGVRATSRGSQSDAPSNV